MTFSWVSQGCLTLDDTTARLLALAYFLTCMRVAFLRFLILCFFILSLHINAFMSGFVSATDNAKGGLLQHCRRPPAILPVPFRYVPLVSR